MAERGSREFTKEQLTKLTIKVDSLTPSPEKRAAEVWNHIRNHGADFDTWDIVSFCSWFLSFSSPEFPFLRNYALILNKQVHAIHYQVGYELGLYKLEDIEELLKDNKNGIFDKNNVRENRSSVLGNNSEEPR